MPRFFGGPILVSCYSRQGYLRNSTVCPLRALENDGYRRHIKPSMRNASYVECLEKRPLGMNSATSLGVFSSELKQSPIHPRQQKDRCCLRHGVSSRPHVRLRSCC